jgi:hypothetical protein
MAHNLCGSPQKCASAPPHSGLRRVSWWLSHQLSVTLSSGTPLCPYPIAYRRAYGLSFRWTVLKNLRSPLRGTSSQVSSCEHHTRCACRSASKPQFRLPCASCIHKAAGMVISQGSRHGDCGEADAPRGSPTMPAAVCVLRMGEPNSASPPPVLLPWEHARENMHGPLSGTGLRRYSRQYRRDIGGFLRTR